MPTSASPGPPGPNATAEERAEAYLRGPMALGDRDLESWKEFLQSVPSDLDADLSPAKAERLEHFFESRGLIPVAREEGLPSHLLAHLPLTSPRETVCVDSRDLMVLLAGPGVSEPLVSSEGREAPDRTPSLTAFLDSCEQELGLLFAEKALRRLRSPERTSRLKAVVAERPWHTLASTLLVESLVEEGRGTEAPSAMGGAPPSSPGPERLGVPRALLWAGALHAAGRTEEAIDYLRGTADALPKEGLRGGLEQVASALEGTLLRGPEDAARLAQDLEDALATAREFALGAAPKYEARAYSTYLRTPEGRQLRTIRDPKQTLSFGLFSVLSFPVEELGGSTAAEALCDEAALPYPAHRWFQRAIDGARTGSFEVVDPGVERAGRRLFQVRDRLEDERLQVTFWSAEPGAIRTTVGTVLRGTLVPWGPVWVFRGPFTTTTPSPKPSPSRPIVPDDAPIVWAVQAVPLHPERAQEGSVAVVADELTDLVLGVEAGPLPLPALVGGALDMASRNARRLPDLLVSPEGFPHWDPQHGSLLKDWTRPRGVRHRPDAARAHAILDPVLAEVLGRAKAPPKAPRRGARSRRKGGR